MGKKKGANGSLNKDSGIRPQKTDTLRFIRRSNRCWWATNQLCIDGQYRDHGLPLSRQNSELPQNYYTLSANGPSSSQSSK
jgi:hypothetical protein